MNNLLIKNLNKTLKNSNFSLKNISLELKPNEVIGLIGENGSGKSTLLNTITSRYIKDSGKIYFFEKEVDFSKRSYKNYIGVVFDNITLPYNLNIFKLNKIFHNIYNNWDSVNFFKYIKAFNLNEEHTISNFSRGMSMKLSIAIALSHKPRILFLDEATSGLDDSSKEKINFILKDYASKGNSIIFTSHVAEDINFLADTLVFLKNGEIIFKIDKHKLLDEFSIYKSDNDYYLKDNLYDILAYRKIGESYEFLIKSAKESKKDNELKNMINIIMEGHIIS